MAYSLDLAAVPLDGFAEILTTVELLPSRKELADHILAVAPRLKARGVEDLEALRKLVANKQRYRDLAEELGVSEKYLTLLSREVNAYRSRPVPLSRLEVFSESELARFGAAGIRSTKDLYERGAVPSDRKELAEHLAVDEERLLVALELSNLVRINGVGPAFARFFRELGIRGPEDVLNTETEEILRRYTDAPTQAEAQQVLRVEDIEYCKRFSVGLESDIVW